MEYCVAASGFNTKTIDNPPKQAIEFCLVCSGFNTKTFGIPPKP